jgi:hypothetical protein
MNLFKYFRTIALKDYFSVTLDIFGFMIKLQIMKECNSQKAFKEQILKS